MQIEKHSYADKKQCIEVKGVNFNYGHELVLKDVTFSVKKGEYFGIIGPNGGGKTTLLKVILGLLKPSSGEVRVFGHDIHTLKEERSHIGYVPQRSSQIDVNFPATVEEIVRTGRTAGRGFFHKFTKADRDAINHALDITDILPYRDHLVDSLSGGQRQRVFIARALAGEPDVIILDEPTVGVDIASGQQFFGFLADLNKTYGLTVILVSHDIDVIAKEVQSLLCINHKVICIGPSNELLNNNYLEQLYGKNVHFTYHGH